VAATAVVVLTCGIGYSGRHAASFLGSLELQGPIAIAVQEPLSTAKGVPSEDRSPFHTEQVQAREPRTATLLPREGTSEDEVVYIGNDVTVRYFTPMVCNTQRLKSNRPSQGAPESSGLGTTAPSEMRASGAKH
jgi:hypothetical protein